MPQSPGSASRPTVALIVNQAWVAIKFRLRLMQSLRDAGWRVVVVTDMRSDVRRQLANHCDEIVHVPVAAVRIDPIADLRTLAGYWQALRRMRPAAALTFTIKPNIYGSLACHALGVPVINNVTGLGTAQGAGAFVAAIVRLLYRRAFGRSAWVFFQNHDDAAEMVSRKLVRDGRWSVLPGSGVDTATFVPTGGANADAATAVRICMMSRLLLEKGVVEFADAAARVRRERPQARFDLWGIADPDDTRYVRPEQVAAWVAEGRLEFHGEAADARQAFASADVVVLPSYYREGLPRTLLEAASMGLPVITTDSPGCREAVDVGNTGYLCAARDANDLADALLRMIDLGAAARRALGEAARRRATEHFDERVVLDQYAQRLAALRAA
jgi:glycosyltransferase involved in cell wall biosynthesis